MISLQLINLQLSPERIIMYNHYFVYNSEENVLIFYKFIIFQYLIFHVPDIFILFSI